MLVPGAPERLQKFIAPHGAGGVLNQMRQKLKLFKGEHQLFPIKEHLTTRQIDQDAIGTGSCGLLGFTRLLVQLRW